MPTSAAGPPSSPAFEVFRHRIVMAEYLERADASRMQEGGLNVLSGLVRYSDRLPPGFVTKLLQVRLAMGPAYARAAIENAAASVAALLSRHPQVDDTPAAFAHFDWTLHHTLTVASGNQVYTLMLNGFAGFYEQVAQSYFAPREARAASSAFYDALLAAAQRADAGEAERVTRAVMEESIGLWTQIAGEDRET